MPFAARTGLLFALMLTSMGASRNQYDPTRLMVAMRGAAGPVWSAHLVSVSRLTFEGAPAVVSTDAEGMRIIVRHCTGELCNGTFFDGERLFSFNINGTTLPQSPAPQPYLRSLALVATLGFLSPGFTARGGRVGLSGSESLGGRVYDTLAIADPFSVPMHLYVDPNTHLLRYARVLNGSDTFEFRNYRRAGMLTLPFEVLHNGQLFERFDDRTAVSIAFHAPRGLQPLKSGAETIPTDPKTVEPIVDCSVGGVAARCLIDTGNSGLSLSSELASRLGSQVVGNYDVRGLGGYATQVVRAGPLHLGNLTYPDAYYVVLNDLRRYGYDVVLGTDVFGSTSVIWDAANHVVRFGAAFDPHAISVPLTFEHSVPVVRVGLGTLQTDLAVDTGDESNINLAYDYYAKHTGLFTVTARRFVSGIGGNSVEVIGEIGSVTIGGFQTGAQRIGATWTLQATASGHLGAAFWQQFIVGFDYANGELRLVPRHGT